MDDPQVLDALWATEVGQRRAMLEVHVREQVAQVMRLDPTQIDPRMPFGSLGLDSLMGLEIRNRLERSLGLTLSAALVWTYPTIAALIAFLAEALELPADARRGAASNGAEAQPRDEMAETRAQIAELSDDEAERILLQELEKLADRNNKEAA